MARYSRDPFWLNARYAGKCATCGDAFQVATRVFFYPIGKTVLSGRCAEKAAAEFTAAAADEDGGF